MRALALVSAFGLLCAGLSAGGAQPTAGPSPAARKPAPSAFDRLVTEATRAQAAGKLDVAAAAYAKAVALRPTWTEGHWSLATLLYDLDRCSDAGAHFTKVLSAQPENGLALALKALCDVRLRRYDAALHELQLARVAGIPNSEVRKVAAFQAALLLNRAGDSDAALDVLREFAIDDKDSPEVLIAFGLLMLRLPTMPEELPAENRAMVLLAGRGGYHLARGRRSPIGRLALEELISRYPTQPHAHYALGVYIVPEDPDAALAEFERELRLNPEHYPSLVQIAVLETRRGNATAAVPFAERAVALAPDVPAARLALGRALLDTQETQRAIEELEHGAVLAPQSAPIQFALARAYQRAGRPDDAARARQLFLKLDSGPGAADTNPSGAPPPIASAPHRN